MADENTDDSQRVGTALSVVQHFGDLRSKRVALDDSERACYSACLDALKQYAAQGAKKPLIGFSDGG